MTDGHDRPTARTAAALVDAEQLTGRSCVACGATLCGHAAVFALVLGYKSAPRCPACTAAHMQERADELRERTLAYVRHHECFLAAWNRAGEREASVERVRPACVFGDAPVVADVSPVVGPPVEAVGPVTVWNAGAMGCGDLVLELRQRLAALPPGAVLELRAEDPGAPIDLPAWCSLTGHTLLDASHPVYRVRRKA